MPSNSGIVFNSISNTVKDTEYTILQYENTSGSPQALAEIGGTGTSRAEWEIFINGQQVARRRTSTTEINLVYSFNRIQFDDGDILTLKVTHYQDETQDFSADLRYIVVV
jgi:hypothetical protein